MSSAGPSGTEVPYGTSSPARGQEGDDDLAGQMLAVSLGDESSSTEVGEDSFVHNDNNVLETSVGTNAAIAESSGASEAQPPKEDEAAKVIQAREKTFAFIQAEIRKYEATKKRKEEIRKGKQKVVFAPEPSTSFHAKDDAGSSSSIDRTQVMTFEEAQARYKREYCVFVANLPDDQTDLAIQAALTRAFSEFGIVHLKVKRGVGWKAMPYAFLQYTNRRDAERAFEEGKNVRIFKRLCRTEWGQKNRFFIISRRDGADCTADAARGLMSHHGEISSIKPASRELCEEFKIRQGVVLEYGFFTAERDRAICGEIGEYLVQLNRPDKVQLTKEEIDRTYLEEYERTKRSIYVGRLPVDCTDAELTAVFQRFGPVAHVNIVRPESEFFKTFGFVEFESDISAREALMNKDGCQIRPGWNIVVDQRNTPTRSGSRKPSSNPPGRTPTRKVSGEELVQTSSVVDKKNKRSAFNTPSPHHMKSFTNRKVTPRMAPFDALMATIPETQKKDNGTKAVASAETPRMSQLEAYLAEFRENEKADKDAKAAASAKAATSAEHKKGIKNTVEYNRLMQYVSQFDPKRPFFTLPIITEPPTPPRNAIRPRMEPRMDSTVAEDPLATPRASVLNVVRTPASSFMTQEQQQPSMPSATRSYLAQQPVPSAPSISEAYFAQQQNALLMQNMAWMTYQGQIGLDRSILETPRRNVPGPSASNFGGNNPAFTSANDYQDDFQPRAPFRERSMSGSSVQGNFSGGFQDRRSVQPPPAFGHYSNTAAYNSGHQNPAPGLIRGHVNPILAAQFGVPHFSAGPYYANSPGMVYRPGVNELAGVAMSAVARNSDARRPSSRTPGAPTRPRASTRGRPPVREDPTDDGSWPGAGQNSGRWRGA
ncbi:hypothetical protein B0T16DRAFT_451898 [Cercophora newfieldiana]|uniref:RRM domain-containing protein n=1 Tax=Cercophora newfieldiana TaxID=92897 RepID=A0AA39YPG4_9PEZI|nr:hypothetical protein B0T16DRAFT_451898 [Cercophora newfieldiana]